MLNYFFKILIVLFFIFNKNFVLAQSTNDFINWGNDSYNAGDYYGASYYYKNAFELDTTNLNILWKKAESDRLFNNYIDAENEYKRIINLDKYNKFPLALFKLAIVNKNNGKYEEAYNNYSKYLELNSDKDDFYTQQARYETANYPKIIKIASDSVNVIIENLGSAINTTYSEFGALQLSDSNLFFSSLRNIDSVPQESFFQPIYLTKIYLSNSTPMGWKNSAQWKSKINSKDKHDGNITFTSDHSCLFFSRCQTNTYIPSNCEIFKSKFNKGSFQKPEKLNNKINLQGYSATQPSFSGKNCKTDGVLYFSSDRPGGYGKSDIWYSIYKDGKFHEPVNLGSIINTPGDEITPFYHTQTGILYFSSDWHAGIGGFDIFKSKGALGEWAEPINMGIPINSNANDLYFSVNEIDKDGYLTSNRKGSMFIKGETCCNDIFSYTWTEKQNVTEPEIVEIIKDTIEEIRQKIKLLLPITLYFHNDEPDPNSWKTESSKNYRQTLIEYMQMTDIYKKEYSKGLNGEQKTRAENDIDDFFINYVNKGFTDLQKFTSLLLFDLQNGNDIHIKIKGFCSPLNTSEYNLNLAKRRISSFKNYLKEYAGGVFIKYLNGTSADGGKLSIYEDPIGKAQASPFVSDNPNDKRNSIYSRAAAFERKVQLIMYSEGKGSISNELPELFLETNVVNFGKIKSSSQKSINLKFKNTGNSELVINNIETSSSALSVSFPSKSVLPEQEGELKISYNSASKTGIYSETMTIISNSAQGKILIEIKIEVE
jgi:tetratricopeptide (TPR) repeat protein